MDRVIEEKLVAQVEEAIRSAVATEVMPRWRQLAADEVIAKTAPHDLVTVADRAAEARLTGVLAALLPGSAVVGEEAVHEDPTVLGALGEDAPVWIVDPIDGTRQFVRGETGFCTLVALARRGELLASWTYAPARAELAVARRGAGAHLNGAPLATGSPAAGADIEVACSHPDFTTPTEKRALAALETEGMAPRPCGAAGLEYLRVARGHLDALAFSWEHPWDHAAGLLLVEEAGGTHATLTGEPFRLTGGNALPFTTARDTATAHHVLALLRTGQHPGAAA